MSVPRLLLLTGTTPGSPGVGGIFLHDLCISYPRESICCFTIAPLDHCATAKDLDWLPMDSAPLLAARDFRAWDFLGDRASRLLARRSVPYVNIMNVNVMNTPALVARAVEFGREHRVDMVWTVLNSPALFSFARRVATELGSRLVVTVWDPPERLMTDQAIDRLTSRVLLHEFGRALSQSTRCGVASEGMAEAYKGEYRVDPVVLIHGAHPDQRRPPGTQLTGQGQFVIGLAGSLYASREWQALLSALSKADWRLEGRDVTVRVLGGGVSVSARTKTRIEYLGWRSFQETVELISHVDVAYLPYWFDKAYSLSVRLCFPNKMTAYLAAGRPVLFHGPEDSSAARFIRRYPVGLCCHSLKESEIIDSLTRFIRDKELYASCARASQVALDEELDLRVFRRRFAKLIGIEEGDLVSLA